MKEILRNVIFKYMNIMINDDKQNLLDIPILLEYWLYFISEIEEKYHLPIIQVIEKIECDDFTLEKICENLQFVCEQNKLNTGNDSIR